MFERYQCREQALALAMMETVVNGVSARKAELITEELSSNLVTNQIWALFI
jgi:transposase-like protein